MDQEEQWAQVELGESLLGRKAGGSAAQRAREHRRADPFTLFRSTVLRQRTDERAWRKGANGERFTAWVLGGLPKGWHVLNDIPVGDRGANIDHLVIGPGGIFTVNTKNLTGKVVIYSRALYVNGHRTSYYPAAKHEAERASKLLTAHLGRPVTATGVLAILADDIDIKARPVDLLVGTPRGAKAKFLKALVSLSEQDVVEITAAASKPETWTPRRPAATATLVTDSGSFGEPCTCGGVFVERTRKADGERFLGCIRFPKCRQTRQIGPPSSLPRA
jgi:hypothetical protein